MISNWIGHHLIWLPKAAWFWCQHLGLDSGRQEFWNALNGRDSLMAMMVKSDSPAPWDAWHKKQVSLRWLESFKEYG